MAKHLEFDIIQKRLRSGDNQVLKFIFEDFQDYCISKLKMQTSCGDEMAMDIFVDAVLNFRDKIVTGKIKEISNPKAYIYVTCYNMYLVHYTKQKQQREQENDVVNFLYGSEQEDFLQSSINQSEAERLQTCSKKAFEQLGDTCKEILRLSIVNRLSMKEIAREIGYASADVIRTKKMRCMKKWSTLVNKLTG